MAVPDFQSLMLPLLRFSQAGLESSIKEAKGPLAEELQLLADLAEKMDSGTGRFANRLAWAKIHLVRTAEAAEYVRTIDAKVILIDGLRLAELMIDFNVGVSRAHVFEIKQVDSDYFSDER